MRLVTSGNGAQLESISWDPLETGVRAVHVKNGIVIRGQESNDALFLHWHDALTVVPMVLTNNRIVLAPPDSRVLSADLAGQRDAITADLRSIAASKVWWRLEQRVSSNGQELWYAVLGRESQRSSLFHDWESMKASAAGEYRLCVTGTREWVIPILQ